MCKNFDQTIERDLKKLKQNSCGTPNVSYKKEMLLTILWKTGCWQEKYVKYKYTLALWISCKYF